MSGRGSNKRKKSGYKSPIKQAAGKGFQGYPIATVAYYGPTAEQATKVVVAIISSEGAEPTVLEKWFSKDRDIRGDKSVNRQIARFIKRHKVRSVAMPDRLIGCPHEEGIDYPSGETCPECPYWATRDRWTGEVIH